MILDGIEYVLVPRDLFEGKKQEQAEPEPEVDISDFETESLPVRQTDSVITVNTMPDVKKAEGSKYGFAERLKQRKLRPEDVMVMRTSFEEMPETPEIARNDYKNKYPPGKWGFYAMC